MDSNMRYQCIFERTFENASMCPSELSCQYRCKTDPSVGQFSTGVDTFKARFFLFDGVNACRRLGRIGMSSSHPGKFDDRLG